ncbi:MAG TPA: agmatine deiminase family protein [Bryobacteraceae bacterium]|nr:agmatine deiminase family protein [Bryobacteraceae bacterium]
MARAVKWAMPAEWEPHEATWLAWPHEKTDWPGKFEPIVWLYGEIVRHLARVERVRIIVEDAGAGERVRRILKKCHADLQAVDFFYHPTNRSWTRDYCPIFVKNSRGDVAMIHFRFNGWAKYDNFEQDCGVPLAIAEKFHIDRYEPGLVLEGGSIDVNGAGKLLTTEECLLSDVQARNPGVSRRELERGFRKYLGVGETIWLHCGIAGDDTHGHIDDMARFTSRYTVVIAAEPDKSDENHEPLKENLARLRARGDLRIATLPMPEPVFFNRQRLPASYANFYIANRMVLAPVFGDANDRIALNTLARLFPDREVIGIYSRDLVLGLGTLHCMTQQQPSTARQPNPENW